MLIGAEFDAQPSYSRQSSFSALRSYSYKITRLLPFLRDMRILRTVGRHLRHLGRLQPDHGRDRRRRLPRHDGLGHLGLQGDPGRRRGHGRADRHRPAAGAHRAVHARPVPARPRPGRPGLGGDPLMLWLDCPRCGRRPLDEFTFGGERRPSPSTITDPDRARLRRGLDLRQPRRRDDRALVPRVRLPALADGPPRHVDRHGPRGRAVTPRWPTAPFEIVAAQSGPASASARSSDSPRWSPRPAGRASSS